MRQDKVMIHKPGPHNTPQWIKGKGGHYSVNRFMSDEGIRHYLTFDVNDMNFWIFSTSGIHGSWMTLEEVITYEPDEDDDEEYDPELTVMFCQPRMVCFTYGNIAVKKDDHELIALLKRRRDESRAVMMQLGYPEAKQDAGSEIDETA